MPIVHTQEPWSRYRLAPDSDVLQRDIITALEHEVEVTGIVYADEDARRIVACVNACTGIPTDELEAAPVLPYADRRIVVIAAMIALRDPHVVAALHEIGNIAQEDSQRVEAALDEKYLDFTFTAIRAKEVARGLQAQGAVNAE